MNAQRAIVLAAGRGSRLGTLTEALPKCLLPVSGRPLLEWQTESLKAAGVTEIGVVRGYRAQDIKAAGVTFFENPRWSESNMVRSLMCASEWLRKGSCIISYADIIYSSAIVDRLNAARGDLVITYDTNWLELWRRRFDDPLSDAETFRTDETGRLLEIGGRASSVDEIRGQYMGLLKFSPAGWQTIATHLAARSPVDVDRLDMTSLLRQLLAAGVRIDTVPISEPWFEIDDERDLEVATAALSQKR